MHDIEPFYRWDKYYSATDDTRSPYKDYEADYQTYQNEIYGYFIHPDWVYFGSETLYLKILFTDYDEGVTVIELFGEWNDTLHNDVMHLKRNIVEALVHEGITKFILIGEGIINFHGNETDYYEEWFEEIEDGWIAAVNFREFVEKEFTRFQIDYYINFGGELAEVDTWRVMTPWDFITHVSSLITRRLT